jgi:hypothetical protein
VFALGGTNENGEAVLAVTATVFSDYRVADRLTQEEIEDRQFLDFAYGAQQRGELPMELSFVRPPSDPPDLLVTTRGHQHGVELTSITTPEVSRQRLSEVRAVGRNLGELVRSDSTRFAHLIGKQVILSEMASDGQRPPRVHRRRMEEIVDQLAEALGPEIGTVDRTPWTNPESPEDTRIPSEVTMRGRARVDQFYWLEVHQGADNSAAPNVIANCQVELVRRVVADTLIERIQKKDREGTDFILVTTGLPNNEGYVCPADSHIFHLLHQKAVAGTLQFPPLRHVTQVAINHWHYPPWTMVFADRDGLLQRRHDDLCEGSQ